MRHGGQSEIQR